MQPDPSSSARRARPPRGSIALALVVVALALATAPPARASDATANADRAVVDAATLAAPSPELPDLPRVSIELAQVPVASPVFDRAATAYADVAGRQTAARNARVDLDRARTAARVDSRRLQATRVAARARIAGLTARLDDIEGAIRDLAVRSFVAGRNTERLSQALTSETPAVNETDQRSVLSQLSMDVLLAERAAYVAQIDAVERQDADATAGLADATATTRDAGARRAGAVRREISTGTDVATERVTYEQARVLATVKGVEFPLVALDAYYRAAAAEKVARPNCGVEWWGVAGIAKVEGHHGTYGGARLGPDGNVTRPIIGIQLNGTNSTAVIADTDGGAFDGDAAFDRAVGPMQFIPSTWRRYEADGNQDGKMSPFNMYDATLAAANYLCTASHGLHEDPGLRAAYFSYNHSIAYVDHVLRFARGYEDQIQVPEPRRTPATPAG